MVSAVRHKTQTTLSSAKRSGLGAIGRKNSFSPMGLTVSRAEKDIATDTLVRKTILGRKPGEDSGYDYLMGMAVLTGACTMLLRNRFDSTTQVAADFISVSAVLVGLSHFIDKDLPL